MNAAWSATGQLQAAGKTLEYACIGAPPNEAPTFVLLHEGLGCIKLWRDFPLKLNKATGFGVLMYSRAGYGHSQTVSLPRPLDYMTREAIDTLPEVLNNIGVQNAVLVGHSDGATIAAIYTGSIVDARVMGTVLIAPHFFTETAGLQAILDARDAFDHGNLRDRLAKYHQDPDNAFRGWNDSWLNPEFKTWNVTNVLERIQTPVLTIQGQDDPYGSLAQVDAVTERVGQTWAEALVLKNCQHAPHLEHSVKVITAITEFCKPLKPLHDFPTHAYIPGVNKRHPEAAFETLRRTAVVGYSADQLAQCQAYRAGLQFLQNGYYWEAHEVLEPVWMALAKDSVEKAFVQGLIQLANGQLKLLMNRPKAAQRLVGKSRALIPADPKRHVMTLDVRKVHRWIDALEDSVNLAL